MAASLLSTALTMSLVLAVSVFLYGTFYYAYMPVELVNMPVSTFMVIRLFSLTLSKYIQIVEAVMFILSLGEPGV